MKVFLSSSMAGYEALRDAAASAIRALGYEVVRAEDFGASPSSPQQACLAAVRAADVVVLVLGERYGDVQSSWLSATHEEYREARDQRPVLAFIQRGGEPESRQVEFIREVQGWEQHYIASFEDPADLQALVTRGLHDHALANASAPLDEAELVSRAQSLLAGDRRQTSGGRLSLAVAGGPRRSVLRPAELESTQLRKVLLAEALTGEFAVLTPAAATDTTVRGDAIELVQPQAQRLVRLNELGDILVAGPALPVEGWRPGIPSIIEEDITETLVQALRFVARVLDHIDGVQRLSHVAPLAALTGANYVAWRTRAEHERSPNRAGINMGGTDNVRVELAPPVRRRPALVHDVTRLAEDFTVRLRRGIRGCRRPAETVHREYEVDEGSADILRRGNDLKAIADQLRKCGRTPPLVLMTRWQALLTLAGEPRYHDVAYEAGRRCRGPAIPSLPLPRARSATCWRNIRTSSGRRIDTS
ncbi:MAG: DUF4062 domain-containing protein [Frankiaceae bacterium]